MLLKLSHSLKSSHRLTGYATEPALGTGRSHSGLVGTPSTVTPAKSLPRTPIRGRSPEGVGGDSLKAGSDLNAITLALGIGTDAAGLR